MRKRGIAASLAAVLLSLTLCGCWQDKCYSEDDYKRNYEDGFYAGVDAANKADAACLLDGPGSGIGVNAEILDSYLAGEGGVLGAALAPEGAVLDVVEFADLFDDHVGRR